MKIIGKILFIGGLITLAMTPMAAHADYSKCTKAIKAQGYFITDVDSDWGRPYDRFEGIKDGRDYDIYVEKNTCKIVKAVLDDRYDKFNN
jgi:hypothetical protein